MRRLKSMSRKLRQLLHPCPTPYSQNKVCCICLQPGRGARSLLTEPQDAKGKGDYSRRWSSPFPSNPHLTSAWRARAFPIEEWRADRAERAMLISLFALWLLTISSSSSSFL